MEGLSALKKPRIISSTEAALSRLYTFRANAFISWIRDATEEERAWAKRVFKCHDKPSWEWVVRSDNNAVMLVNGIGSVYLTLERDVCPLDTVDPRVCHVDIFPLLTHMWERDNAICMLDKGALSVIYGMLHSPQDMLNFMRVNKRFHQAGVEYFGYEQFIQRLVKYTGIRRFPLFRNMPNVKPYQKFFAMCFLSCKDDDTYSCCALQEMRGGNWDLLLYVRNVVSPMKSGGFLEAAEMDYLWFPHEQLAPVTYYVKLRDGTMEATPLLDNEYIRLPRPYTDLPMDTLRRSVEDILFPRRAL